MGPDQPFMSQTPQMPAPVISSPGGRNKLPLVIGLAVGSIVLMLILALVFGRGGGGGDQTETPESQTSATSIVSNGASALDVQQVNDSISQDMSSLNNDQDFPAEQLSDDTLGL